MAILKSQYSSMTIEINLIKITTIDDSNFKWIYFDVKIMQNDKPILKTKTKQNFFSGAFDTIFGIPSNIRQSVQNGEIRVIETEQCDFGKFIVFPSTLISFHSKCTHNIDENLFNFGYWVAERNYDKNIDNDFEDGKIMFTLEVEKDALLDFADKIEAEYKALCRENYKTFILKKQINSAIECA
ncbi:MAG: hypothetical protein RL154_1562, partial [Pseudomonadota bacterium]